MITPTTINTSKMSKVIFITALLVVIANVSFGQSSHIGAWKAESGRTIELNSDGTGALKMSANVNPITEFSVTEENNEGVVFIVYAIKTKYSTRTLYAAVLVSEDQSSMKFLALENASKFETTSAEDVEAGVDLIKQ